MADVTASDAAIRHPVQSRQRELHALAARQHGRVAHRQLLDRGFSTSGIHRMVRAGRLVVVHRGVYAVGHVSRTAEGNWMGAVLAAGPGTRLGYRSAAAALALRRTASGLIEVCAPSRSRRRIRGVRLHQTGPFHPEDVGEVKDIPVTSVPRTILDCAEVLPAPQLVRMLEQAERIGLYDSHAMNRVIVRSHGRRGLKPLLAALSEVNGEPPRVNSDWERDFLDFCDDHALARPQLNVLVQGYVVDAFWPAAKLVVELDSWTHHRGRTAFESDREKVAELQLARYTVLPVTWRRLQEEPDKLAAQIRRRVGA